MSIEKLETRPKVGGRGGRRGGGGEGYFFFFFFFFFFPPLIPFSFFFFLFSSLFPHFLFSLQEMNVGEEDNIAHMLITKAMQANDCHDNITAILVGL